MNLKNTLKRILPLREKKFEWMQEQLLNQLVKNGEQTETFRKSLYKEVCLSAFEQTSGARFIFLGSPTHGNLGDQALSEAQKRIVSSVCQDRPYLEVTDQDYFEFLPYLLNLIHPQDTILLAGGGNLGNEYMLEEQIRRSVIFNFPANRIIIMPQTMFFTKDQTGHDEERKTAQIYGDHRKLHLFAREQASCEMMKDVFPENDVRLVPDMVLYPDILCRRHDNVRLNQVLCCFREDKESALTVLERAKMRGSMLKKLQAPETDMILDSTRICPADRMAKIFEKADEFRQSKFVVTDRLHGMIFSVITGTPCIVFGNYNHKLKSAYSTWLTGRPDVVFLESPDRFQPVAEAWLHEPPPSGMPLDVQLYQPLTDLLKE